MSPFVVLLAAVIGVTVGVFGGGGSVLTVPTLVYGLGIEAKEAVASSLLIVAATSAAGAIPHARTGAVRWGIAGQFAFASVFGAYAGGRSAAFFAPAVLLVLFASMMLISAVFMLVSKGVPQPGKSNPVLIAIVGLAVGFLTGLVGAGGGFIVVPALIGLAGLGVREAIATSLVVLSAKSVAASVGYLGHVRIDWELVGVFTAGAMIGGLVGARVGTRLPVRALTRGFAFLIVGIATYMLWRELPAMLG